MSDFGKSFLDQQRQAINDSIARTEREFLTPPVTVSLDYGSALSPFADLVKQTVVQEPGYRGMGGHAIEDSRAHGRHSQTSIGINNATINFRELFDK